MRRSTKLKLVAIALLLKLLLAPHSAEAFCGFYVGKADGALYNHASQVAMVRNGDKTVISMMNDYQGEPSEFALVVPVPVVLQKGQVHIGDRELFKHLDSYSSPRLVDYPDPNPCEVMRPMTSMAMGAAAPRAEMAMQKQQQNSLGVTIEAQYTVGEYDIVILSATQSDGLETWLQTNGYKIPLGASAALKPYIKQNMKFFVAKVNLKEKAKTGLEYLRPIQFAFESSKFMLPVRLGMINAQGPQDLVLFVITKNGRVETTNYQTRKFPSDQEIPEYVRSDFGSFYKAAFDKQTKADGLLTVFTEYFWNMGWCDPCASEPLSRDELRRLGVFWLDDEQQSSPGRFGGPMYMPMGGALPVMLTRLHIRYSAASFPEDPVFQETQDTQNYQARFIIHTAWKGSPDECPAAKAYLERVKTREEKEAETLADLTGWDLGDVMKKVGLRERPSRQPWWEKVWGPES